MQRYRGKVSGPLLDRFDLHVAVNRLPPGQLLAPPAVAESSAAIRKRVCAARVRQEVRQDKCNAALGPEQLLEICALDSGLKKHLEEAAQRLHLSARGIHRTLRVARSIADLADEPTVGEAHLAEALSLRNWQ